MTKWTIDALQDRLKQTQMEREQALAALARVRDLLGKADERRASEDMRRWNKVIDNLERALDLAKSRLSACDQRIIDINKSIGELATSGAPGFPEETRREFEQLGLRIPTDPVTAAEQIMSMTVDVLRDLTLDQVAELHTMMFNDREEEPQTEAVKDSPAAAAPAGAKGAAKRSQLEERIERARQLKQQREAGVRRHGLDLVERRKQNLLRDGITKAGQAKFSALSFEEVEALQSCHKQLAERSDLSESDARLANMLDRFAEAVEIRGRELRRKRAQDLLHKKP